MQLSVQCSRSAVKLAGACRAMSTASMAAPGRLAAAQTVLAGRATVLGGQCASPAAAFGVGHSRQQARGFHRTMVTMGLKTGIVGLPNVGKVRRQADGPGPADHRRRPLLCRLLPARPPALHARPMLPRSSAPCACPRSPPCSTRCVRTPRRRPPTSPSARLSPTSASWRSPTPASRWVLAPPAGQLAGRLDTRGLSALRAGRLAPAVVQVWWQWSSLARQAACSAAPCAVLRRRAQVLSKLSGSEKLIPTSVEFVVRPRCPRRRRRAPAAAAACAVSPAVSGTAPLPPPLHRGPLVAGSTVSVSSRPFLTTCCCAALCPCRTLRAWSRAPARARAWATSSWQTSGSATPLCRWVG